MSLHARHLLILLSLSALLAGGCLPSGTSVPDRIILDSHASGNDQQGAYGEALPDKLRVVVQSPQIRGMLGGKGSRHPLAGLDVVFTVREPGSGALFEETRLPNAIVRTDAAGQAAATLVLGDHPGDVTVDATVQTPSGPKSVALRATAGVFLLRDKIETRTGATAEDVGVRLLDPTGAPARGVTVYFHVDENGNKASVSPERVITDDDGRAATSWRLGDASGRYFLDVEIQDQRADIPPEMRFHGRQISVNGVALNPMGIFVTLFGGLAVFIFGMKLMSTGLQRMADKRLKSVLNAITRNRWMAVGTGALATALVQSSSASTVMVVGFVNAGLLTLAQAIGVVFGANIGTTITAQIIAFNVDALAYPAIMIGLMLASLARRPSRRALGESILGFGLLFLGLTVMSDVLRPLRHSYQFQAWFQVFDCSPIDGIVPWQAALMCIVIGTVTTIMVQSSSASIGLVIAFAAQGLLSFPTAFALVLGDNIGTTITAQLASIGTNRNARRAALAHTLFNAVGALYMYILLFVPLWNGQPLFLGFISWITPGDVFAAEPENLPRHIANAHTLFNVFNCMLFTPMIGLMVRLCMWVIPLKSEAEETLLVYLEPHLLNTPPIAIAQTVNELDYMLQRARKAVTEAIEYFHGGDATLVESIRQREKDTDRLQKEITAYLTRLSRVELTPEESAAIPKLIHAVNDAERIGDHAVEIVLLANQVREGNLQLAPAAVEDLARLELALVEQFTLTHRTLTGEQEEDVRDDAKRAKRGEREIDELAEQVAELHVSRLEKGTCDVSTGVVYLDYVANLERIGDHLFNISKRARRLAKVTIA